MSTQKDSTIPFSVLFGEKRVESTDIPELRLLPLFPLGAQEPRLLELRPPGFSARAQEPRLLQLFSMSKGIEANDGTLGSHPVVGTSEPELPNLPAKHHSQPRLLQLFPVSKGIEANDGTLGSHPAAGTSEPELPSLLANHHSQPRLLQLFPVSKGIEANDGTLGSHPVVGTSEPELPNLPAKHHSQPRLLQLFPVSKGIEANDGTLGSHPAAGTSEPELPSLLANHHSQPRLLQLFPVSKGIEANDGTLGSHPVVGTSEPELPNLLAKHHSQPRLLQLFPVSKGIEANDGTLGSHLVAGTSEPELPYLLAKHHSQPLASSALAQRSGNSLLPDGRVQDMLDILTAGNKIEGFLSRRTNSFSTRQAEHPLHPARVNVTTLVVAAICVSSQHPTREVNSGRDTANQSGIASTGREIAETRPVQEPMPTMAKHVGRRNPEREDSTSRSLQAINECVRSGQLAIQDPFTPESTSRTSMSAGGQPVIMRLSTGVAGNATNPTKLAPAAQPRPTGEINVGLAETNEFGSSLSSARIIKKRPLAIQDPISTRVEHVGRRQYEKDDLANKSTPESREHVSQRLPLSNVPLKKRPRRNTGGEPVLGPVHIEASSGQQDLSTRPSVSSSGARSVRPLPNRRHPVRREVQEGGPRGKSSAYKGVTRYKRTKRWEANIWHDRKQTYLGAHATEIQAARAYDRALIHFRGEEAQLNFNLDDYRAELTQLSSVRSEDLVVILRKQSRGPGKPMPDYTYRRRS